MTQRKPYLFKSLSQTSKHYKQESAVTANNTTEESHMVELSERI